MSLRETIEGARREAAGAGGLGLPKKDAPKDTSNADEAEEPRGFARRSVARAKPAREAARGVRVVSASSVRSGRQVASGKSHAEMSREERKNARRARREQDDRVAQAARVLMRRNPEYRRDQRVWWITMGVGMALILVSTALSAFPGGNLDYSTVAGFLAIVCLVLSYGAIIGGFVYDWRKVRPIRNAASELAASMTPKKLQQIIESDDRERATRASERAKAKEARRARRSTRHEQSR